MLNLNLISETYDAAMRPEVWPEVLERLAREFGAKHSALIAVDQTHEMANLAQVSANWPPNSIEAYFEVAGKYESPDFKRLMENSTGYLVRDTDFYGSVEACEAHPCGTWLKCELGVMHRTATCLSRHGAWIDVVAVQYPVGRQPITDGEIDSKLRGAVVFLTDPANRGAFSESGMDQIYGLTRAEFDILSLILDGFSTESTAEHRNTTIHTTRDQMKNLMGKTNASTRVDLVRLATKMNPPVDRSRGD